MGQFWQKVRVSNVADSDACWLWTGALHPKGYGHKKVGGATVQAHRWSYEQFVGPIPEGLHIDHLCRVRNCVNPDHLEAVTNAENLRRGRNAEREKTRCPLGHPYDEANTFRTSTGKRVCRTCRRRRQTEYNWRVRGVPRRLAEYAR